MRFRFYKTPSTAATTGRQPKISAFRKCFRGHEHEYLRLKAKKHTLTPLPTELKKSSETGELLRQPRKEGKEGSIDNGPGKMTEATWATDKETSCSDNFVERHVLAAVALAPDLKSYSLQC